MDEITVPTYEQIETILSKLATNYSNIAILFYDIFYNTTPKDVTLQMYDEAGVLQTYTIPNRAKDMANILSGNGAPENVVEAGKGVLYQDLMNGDLYIKLTSEGNVGWAKFATSEEVENIIMEGVDSPEGIVIATKGTLFVDKANANLYIKATDEGNTGWILISANTENLANRDLSNLSNRGENHFAKADFSNINVAAQAMFNAKENIANKVTSITSGSTDLRYPSAKAVYTFTTGITDNLADKDFSNITHEAESRFLGTNKLSNGVLEATTVMERGVDNSFVMYSGTKLLCTNGINSDNTYKNEIVSIVQNVSGVIPNTTSTNGLSGYIFYKYTGGTTGNMEVPKDSSYFVGTTTPTIVADGVWYNPEENKYYTTETVSGALAWKEAIMVEIGKWSTNPDGTVKTFIAYNPIKIVSTTAREVSHAVVEVGGTENNWYRLYNDGWLEAGGYLTGGGTVNLLKEFKSTHYTLVPSSNATSFTKAVGSFTLTVSSSSAETDWIAKGWAA